VLVLVLVRMSSRAVSPRWALRHQHDLGAHARELASGLLAHAAVGAGDDRDAT
jgi:hypothetical protein